MADAVKKKLLNTCMHKTAVYFDGDQHISYLSKK